MVASLIATSFYFLTNVYYRFAVGEYLAMIFMPVLVAGMWDFVYNDFKNKKYIIIGMLGIVFSHTISIIIAVTFCIIFSLINIKIILKNPNNIDIIYKKSKNSIGEINQILLMLEIEGYIKKTAGGYECIQKKN